MLPNNSCTQCADHKKTGNSSVLCPIHCYRQAGLSQDWHLLLSEFHKNFTELLITKQHNHNYSTQTHEDTFAKCPIMAIPLEHYTRLLTEFTISIHFDL